MDQEHGTVTGAHHLFRHAPEDPAAYTASSVRSHHDQICIPALGVARDCFGDRCAQLIKLDQARFGGYARCTRNRNGMVQNPRANLSKRPADIVQIVELGVVTERHGVHNMNDTQLGAQGLCQARRFTNRESEIGLPSAAIRIR